jgi:imidazolonepropionase
MNTVITNARALTLDGPSGPRRGAAMRNLAIRERCDIVIRGEWIVSIGESMTIGPGDRIIDAGGRIVMPGLIDCHTHACFAGSRIDEWERKLAGATYQEIMAAGGGIMSTVKSTRAATRSELSAILAKRLHTMLGLGSTTVEVKSGYGLTAKGESHMLDAISDVQLAQRHTKRHTLPGIIATALLGHAIDPDVDDFVHRTIHDTLPAISKAHPGIAIDAFCEKGAWSQQECWELFTRAQSLGHPIRVHTDQFTSLGMTAAAASLGARSCDHLEASTASDVAALAGSSTVGVALPCCGFHLDGRYANLRLLIDAGGAAAVATNFNPGSAPCPSMTMALGLAVRHCGLTPAEAIIAGTVNAAAVLGLSDRGVIAAGKRADLLILNSKDWRTLVYEFASPLISKVLIGGEDFSED